MWRILRAIKRLVPQAPITDELRSAVRKALANCARHYDSPAGDRFKGRDIVLLIAQTAARRVLGIDLSRDGIFTPEQAAEWESAKGAHTRKVEPPAPAPTAPPTPAWRDGLEAMLQLLYKADGYRRVIQMAGELSSTPIAKRAEYWFYLSAAFGQKMHHADEGSDERRSARDNALDAARRAVLIDESFGKRLWAISDPEGIDSDLALLRNNNAFRQIVGRK
jgi:hypothetical protein